MTFKEILSDVTVDLINCQGPAFKIDISLAKLENAYFSMPCTETLAEIFQCLHKE